MVYRSPPRRELPTCSAHGLRYDWSIHSGCAICRGAAPGPLSLERPALLLFWAIGGIVLAVGVVVGVVAKRRTLTTSWDRVSVPRLSVPYRGTASCVPVIERIDVAPGAVRAGRPTTLTCVATVIGDEPNLYRWLGPFGATNETGASYAVWTPAGPQSTTVTCIARNSVGSVRATADVRVLAAGP